MQELLPILGIVGAALVLGWVLRRFGVSSLGTGHCAPSARSHQKVNESGTQETEEEAGGS